MYRPWPRGTLLAYLRNPTKRNLYRWLNIVSPSATYAPPERITWGTPSGGCACGQLCICGPAGAGPALGGQQEGGQGC